MCFNHIHAHMWHRLHDRPLAEVAWWRRALVIFDRGSEIKSKTNSELTVLKHFKSEF